MNRKDAMRRGRCHCGRVRFEAELPPRLHASRCNCSICAMKGAAMVYLPRRKLRVTQGEDALSCYRFNTMAARHWFCSHCGIHCFHQTRTDPETCAINTACIEGLRPYEDFPEIAVFDGVHHPLDHAGVRHIAGMLHFEAAADRGAGERGGS